MSDNSKGFWWRRGSSLNGERHSLQATAWLPVFGQTAGEKGQRRAKGSRGAEESHTKRQPLKRPWRKVSPRPSPPLLSTFLYLWADICQQPGSLHCYCSPHQLHLDGYDLDAMTRIPFWEGWGGLFLSRRKKNWTHYFCWMHKNAQTIMKKDWAVTQTSRADEWH